MFGFERLHTKERKSKLLDAELLTIVRTASHSFPWAGTSNFFCQFLPGLVSVDRVHFLIFFSLAAAYVISTV